MTLNAIDSAYVAYIAEKAELYAMVSRNGYEVTAEELTKLARVARELQKELEQ